MEIIRKSFFKNGDKGMALYRQWVLSFEAHTKKKYESIELETSLGKTQVYSFNTQKESTNTLVIFPGYRTSSLFWDFDCNLDNFSNDVRIFMIETNGQPNCSDGNTPDIHSNDYGKWAGEVLDKLGIKKAYIAGASFGGLVAMKLAIQFPEKVQAAFLLNPACLQSISLKPKNLYYNLLPFIFTSPKTVATFLRNVVFKKPQHQITEQSERLLIDFQLLALNYYIDKAQKPYFMKEELKEATVPAYLLLSDNDILFPAQKSAANAKQYLAGLKDYVVFENTAHGLETYAPAMKYINEVIHKTSP
jgi:pimeloyl-ACP methyl ester carboxylesterase